MSRMDYEGFMALVQSRADLSYDDAQRALEAVLGTLSERISGGEAQDLAVELPKQVAARLTKDRRAPAEGFPTEEFFRRVSERQGVDPTDAERITHAVFSAVADSASREEAKEAQAELPGPLKDILELPRIETRRPGRGER